VEIESKVLLASYTSWSVGGPADFFCKPRTLEEVKFAQAWALENKHPLTILGGGSNVLVSDRGVPGLVMCLKDLIGLETRVESEEGREIFKVEAWAGTSKSELLKIFLKQKLAPALFLAGIPGDLGGGLVMNAGVAEMFTPREFTEITEWIEVLRPNGQVSRLKHGDLKWTYRHMSGWEPGILVRAGLRWPNEPDSSILDQVKNANKVRLSKQPLDLPSCGSVFVNPPGLKAAQLIDSCGLKGYTVGQAQVSLKHANFIVNLGGCTAEEIWSVIRHVKKTVREMKGVDLKTEVIRLGEWGETV
jgi:UDP-N-acetylmuramate dehydrogenase